MLLMIPIVYLDLIWDQLCRELPRVSCISELMSVSGERLEMSNGFQVEPNMSPVSQRKDLWGMTR